MPELRHPSCRHEVPPPPPDALLPPPRRATLARKSLQRGAGDGPPNPHPPRPRNKGSVLRTPARRTSGLGRASARTQTPLTGARTDRWTPMGNRKGGTRAGPHPPPTHTQDEQSQGPEQETRRGTNHMERPHQRPARGPREVYARQKRRGARGRRKSECAQAHNGHAGRTRRATGPSPRNAQITWNGVPAGEGKGHPDGTTRHMHREGREEGATRGGGDGPRHWPRPPARQAASNEEREGRREQPLLNTLPPPQSQRPLHNPNAAVATQNMSRPKSMGHAVVWLTSKFAAPPQGRPVSPRAAPPHPPTGDLGPKLGHQLPTPHQRGRLHGLDFSPLTHSHSPRTQHRPAALKALGVSHRSRCLPCANTPLHTRPRDSPRPQVQPRPGNTPHQVAELGNW